MNPYRKTYRHAPASEHSIDTLVDNEENVAAIAAKSRAAAAKRAKRSIARVSKNYEKLKELL